MIVIDTNVLSEPMRPRPDHRLLAWLDANAGALWTSAVTVQEIVFGIQRLKDGSRRERVRRNFEAAFSTLIGSRVLALDEAAARLAGAIAAQRANDGRPIASADAQIAAIAQSNAASLATRNVSDFADIGLALINPWES
ncbi:MAG TPA: PIN domain-containing protein [Rhizomicrobium sp.]